MSVKENIKLKFPKLTLISQRYRKKLKIIFRNRENKDVFNEIYEKNLWENKDSISGPGSTIESTKNFQEPLKHLIQKYGIKTMLDAPCGDFNWMKKFDLKLDLYIGADIVEKLIEYNNREYGNKIRKFIQVDITTDNLPESDMIFCRDCLVHLSNERINTAIKNFKRSGSRYLLTTNFEQIDKNIDIITGDWRKINLELKPFNFTKPEVSIHENCPVTDKNGKLSRDKYLSLWDLNKINI